MNAAHHPLELLSPAKNREFGMEALNHGADAVYIGAPRFGARAAVGNSVADIGALAEYAHRYFARVYVALNTILRDEELEDARRIAWEVYEAGADALIVQDMGLLELDLPPIALHASTQTDNRTPEKVAFLEQAGFSQVVLARELELEQISAIAARTTVPLEFFVHGALCVSYSGQCYISHAETGRSANRGECAQLCRLPYTLLDGEGHVLARDQHLLSLKDMDQSANLRALIDAGISSFKIEGRLKDLAYVKNITAHYRRLLDDILVERPELRRASSGRCQFSFVPQPEKTFNRGSTDYFLGGRQISIASFGTPKFSGEEVGRVVRQGPGWLEVDGDAPMHNGDGVSFFDEHGELQGMRINRVEGRRLFPAQGSLQPVAGTVLYRNRDQAFERLLEKNSAQRKIALVMSLRETDDGFVLEVTDEDGIRAEARLVHGREPARDPGRVVEGIRDQLARLGNTDFELSDCVVEFSEPWFIPASGLNALRREAVEKLAMARRNAYRRPSRARGQAAAYPEAELGYRGNVYNESARAFYRRHGVAQAAPAFECNQEKDAVPLMITRHCLRYSFNLCPRQVKGVRPDPLTLVRGKERYELRFDCPRCEMLVVGRPRQTGAG